MPSEQDFPLYTTDPTTGELVPVGNGQPAFIYNAEQRCFIVHPALFYEGDAQEAVLRDMNENSENT